MTRAATPNGTGPWEPLRNRMFRALFVAQIASNVGTMMHNVGATWLMGDLDPSASLVALVQTAIMLPVFLVALPAGALADIVDRRRLLIVTQLAMLVTALTLAVLSFADLVDERTLLLLTFVLGLGAAFNMPAWQAIQPELVPREQLGQALALGNTTFNVGRAIGPAIGGLIVAWGGPGWVFLINAFSFLAVVAVLVRWRHKPEPSDMPVESILGAIRAGLRYGVHSIALRHVLVRSAVFIVPGAALVSLLPVVARGPLGLGSGGFGVLLACFGIGAASSAAFRPRLVAHIAVDPMMLLATVIVAVGLLVTGLSGNAILIGVTMLVVGAAWTLAITATGVAAQSALPSWVRARGMALWNLAITGGVAVGSALWGAVATWRLGAAHVIAAASMVGLALLTSRWKLSTPERLDVDLATVDEPVVTLMPQLHDGPVLVTVRYDVPADSFDDFTREMRRVERQRRRTGVYRWGLFRDLQHPGAVLETFVVESWAEHLRQHQRMTNTDLGVLGDARRYAAETTVVAHYISCYSSTGSVAPAGSARLVASRPRGRCDGMSESAAKPERPAPASPLWRQGYDTVERRVAPSLTAVARSEQFAIGVGLAAQVQRAVQKQAARSTRRFLHGLNLPAGTDVSRLLAEIGDLKKQVRQLSQQLEAATATKPAAVKATTKTATAKKAPAKKATAKGRSGPARR